MSSRLYFTANGVRHGSVGEVYEERAAADPADTAAGFELCRHDGGTPGGSAPESPGADSHCIFCLAGAAYIDAPAATLQSHTITFAMLSWSFKAWRLPAATVNASALPRGPPWSHSARRP